MYSSSMATIVADSLDVALRVLSEHPGATVLAGGTDCMVEVNAGHRVVRDVVVVNRCAELRGWSVDAARTTVSIGAAVTYRELMDEPFASWFPALAQAGRTVGSPQIRHAATIGGNVATASPAGDGLPVLAALDAVVHLVSRSGERAVPFADFVTGPKRTVLQPDEMIRAIDLPIVDGWQGYAKVGVRNAMVISTAGACLVADRVGSSVRLALGSVGPTILRCTAAEAFARDAVDVVAGRASDEAVRRFAALAAEAARPIDDHRSTAAYRRHAIAVLAGRLLRRACPDE
jgi:CO/xanthine dehydrogenase FAD-binding subunit